MKRAWVAVSVASLFLSCGKSIENQQVSQQEKTTQETSASSQKGNTLNKGNVFHRVFKKEGIGSTGRAIDWYHDALRIFNHTDYIVHYNALPQKGSLQEYPWSGDYWATNNGGLAYRWRLEEKPFGLNVLTQEEVMKMDKEGLAKLSPAEKYDLLKGDYSFSSFLSEVNRSSPEAPYWWGLCHGWAPASLLTHSPKPVTIVNPDGLEIEFGSADIKGLLSGYFANHEGPVQFLGLRCNTSMDKMTPEEIRKNPNCAGVNPASLHILLANEISLNQRGFVADISPAEEVWNQPIYGWKSQEVSSLELKEGVEIPYGDYVAEGTKRLVEMKTTLYYGAESDSSWEGGEYYFGTKELHYRLELDVHGKIIGGEWLGDDEKSLENRIDFIWRFENPNLDQDPLLKKIYEASVGDEKDEIKYLYCGEGYKAYSVKNIKGLNVSLCMKDNLTLEPFSFIDYIQKNKKGELKQESLWQEKFGTEFSKIKGSDYYYDSKSDSVVGPFSVSLVEKCKTYTKDSSSVCEALLWPVSFYKEVLSSQNVN